MVAPGDSLISPPKRSMFKPLLAAVAIAGVLTSAWWMFVRGKGQSENPARVLIIGPTPGLAEFLERRGFDADHLNFGAAVGEGRAFDPELDELAAIVEYADQHGFGYAALSMAHGQRYEFETLDYSADGPPPGTTFAVISIGELGRHLSYGGVPPAVTYAHPVDEQVGLLLGLFAQPELNKVRTQQASNDLMIRFNGPKTVEDVVAYEQAQETTLRQMAAWDALADSDHGEPKPTEFAAPYQRLRGWPLANGAVLLGSGRGAWHSEDGRETSWHGHDLKTDFSFVQADALDQRAACDALPETLALDDGFAISPAGDALLIPSNQYIADLWVLTDDGCGFEKRDEIRRLGGGELGQPRANGRTATAHLGRVDWADANMRAFRQVSFAGVVPHDTDMLRWVSDDIVVVPAGLGFFEAASDRAKRRAAAASESGAIEVEPAPVDPATLPDDREALLFIRLPPAKQQGPADLAVIPVDAILPEAGDPADLVIRGVFPIVGEAATVVALVLAPEGDKLIRVRLGESGPAWQNGLSIDYELAAAVEAGRDAIEVTVLTHDLPGLTNKPELFHGILAVSPTGSHAAWAAPFGAAMQGDSLGNLEIVVLALDPESAADPKPIRLTDNARRDARPRFAGKAGRTLIFDSVYPGTDTLPEVEALRALPLP